MKIKQKPTKKGMIFGNLLIGEVFRNLNENCQLLLKIGRSTEKDNVLALESRSKYTYDDNSLVLHYPNAELDPGDPA